MALPSILVETIEAYTGLSPMAFFTILALSIVVYKTVCGFFVEPEEFINKPPTVNDVVPPNLTNPPPILEPVQLGDVTEQELRAYDGSDPGKPLLMAIKGQIYDVSRSRMFYGPGGPYGIFAGREAARALALLSFDPRDLTADLEGLSESELEVLQDWEYKFIEKYVKVGQIVSSKAVGESPKIEEAKKDQ
ncbi:Membrane steroid-binding protein 2 [Linum perenne]